MYKPDSVEIEVEDTSVEVTDNGGNEHEFEIWYEKNARFIENPPKTVQKRDSKYSKIGTVYLSDPNLEKAYRAMQGQVWSPNGEGNAVMENLGIDHVSMSVGDLIHYVNEDKWYIVANTGFNEFGLEQTETKQVTNK